MNIITTNPEDILNIEGSQYPFLALTDNMRSYISYKIKSHEKGSYNHLLWYVRPGVFYSQDLLFHEVSAEKYLSGAHRIKLIHNPLWTWYEKNYILCRLQSNLEQPWYKRLYDPLQILGLSLGLPWLQIPGTSRICSDHAEVLGVFDKDYQLKHPSPTEVNNYTKNHKDIYSVYMRFIPD